MHGLTHEAGLHIGIQSTAGNADTENYLPIYL